MISPIAILRALRKFLLFAFFNPTPQQIMAATFQDLVDAITAVSAGVTQTGTAVQTAQDAVNAAATRVANMPAPPDFQPQVDALNAQTAALNTQATQLGQIAATANDIAPTP